MLYIIAFFFGVVTGLVLYSIFIAGRDKPIDFDPTEDIYNDNDNGHTIGNSGNRIPIRKKITRGG